MASWFASRSPTGRSKVGYEIRGWHDWVDTVITKVATTSPKVDARNVDALIDLLPGGVQKAIVSRSVGKAAQQVPASGRAPANSDPQRTETEDEYWDEDAEFARRAGMELGAHTALWDAPELGRDREVEEPEDARRGREMLAAWERTQAATSVEESAGEAGGRGLWVPVLGADEVDDSADADARGGTGGQDASSTRGRGAGKKAAGLEDVDDEEERWARSVGEATPEAGAGVGSSVLCAERPGPSSRAAPAPGPSTPGPSTRVPASSTSGATVVPVVRMETSHAPVAGEAAQVPSTPKQVGAHTPSPGQGLTTPQPAATPGKQEWGSSLRAYQVIGNISQTPPPAPPGSPQPAAEETRQAQLGAARRPRPSPRDPASPFLERLRATPESGGPGGFADKYRALRARGEGGESSDDDDDMVV